MTALRAADVAATHRHAARLADLLGPRARAGRAVVVGLVGGLGAGKTEWVRGFLAALGPGREDAVSSPTYAVVHIYEGAPEVRHLDLYRLASLDDLEAIGYRDCYFAPGIALVEWIDHVPEGLPPEWIEVALEPDGSGGRTIHTRGHGSEARSWVMELARGEHE